MSRPIVGGQCINYRKGSRTFQRCSRCQREREMSALVGLAFEKYVPIMVGQDLLGMLCADCVHAAETHIQAIFPDRHAFPFCDERGQLLPTPRCENGHVLAYTEDGSGMVCTQCDVPELSAHGAGAVD